MSDWTTDVMATSAEEALVTAYAAIRSNLSGRHRIRCAWNGVSERGSAITLTGVAANTTGFWGSGGALLIEAAPGFSPCFGDKVTTLGARGIHWRGIGFSALASAYGGSQDNNGSFEMRSTGTFPAKPVNLFEACHFGNRLWRPGSAVSDYVKGTRATNPVEESYFRDCTFDGCYDGVTGATLFQRIHNCDFRDIIGDQVSNFGFTSGSFDGLHCHIWTERNTFRKAIDLAAYASLHRDKHQTGTSLDRHSGYRVLHRRNIAHLGGALTGGSQGNYNDDHTTADNLFVIEDEIILVTSPRAINMWSPLGTRDSHVSRVTMMVAGLSDANDNAPGLAVSNAWGAQRIKVADCIGAPVFDPPAAIDDAGSIVCNPKIGRPTAERPETIFAGPFNRDGGDRLSYALDEAGTREEFIVSAWARFQPQTPYAGKGCPDPRPWFGIA